MNNIKTMILFKANGANIEAVIRIEDEENSNKDDGNSTQKNSKGTISETAID